MIDRDEIEARATVMGVHAPNVERDYVFGWILKAFFENEYLASRLVFKGGNCMRKAFYPETRFSGDLDFSVPSAIEIDRFLHEMNQACRAAQAACGVKFETDRNALQADRFLDPQRQSYKGKLFFWDFHDQPDEILISIRVDLTEFDRIILPTVSRDLLHPYSDADQCRATLTCMSLEELMANKLKCLIQRRHSFDLYDLVYATFFERSIEVDRRLIMQTFLQKTIFQPSPTAAKEILLGLPTAFFRAAWTKYVAPVASRFDFDGAWDGFCQAIDGIFEGTTARPWSVSPFYPSNYRNLILEAGAGKKLMQISYHGVSRTIEPYALKYKRPQGSEAKEYFYVWDRTGGRTSPPGIKTFLHQDIESLELLDEQFEPQYPIELSKAGESGSRDYFGKPFSAGQSKPLTSKIRLVRTPRTAGIRSRPFNAGTTYTFTCSYCGKRFKRTTYSAALNAHKQPNGWPCPGRIGHLT